MIDLHLHLDGSLSEEDFRYLAKLNNVDLGDDFPNNIHVPNDCPSLAEYLKRFDLPLKLLQNEESLKYAIKSLVKRLDEKKYIYAEIRFAPQLHTNQGLSQKEVVKIVSDGLLEALKECQYMMDANLILCMMRHAPYETNLETINSIFACKRYGLIDLAGDETLHPFSYYKELCDYMNKLRIPFIAHAGEATGSDEVMMAIESGAKRIGHGVHLSLDPETVSKVLKSDVCFEFCPTSNLQTKSLKSYEDVPLRKYMELRIPVTINSDNMTVSNCDAISEMKQMIKTFNLSRDEVLYLLATSIQFARLDGNERYKLQQKAGERFNEYYQNLIK